MPLVLDGTNGVSGVDGTASNPAIEGTDSNTGIFYPAADTVAIGTGGTERLRVVSAGDVGVGTSTPATISNRTVLSINNASNGGALNLLVNGTETLRLLTDNSSLGYVYNIANQPLVFGTNGNERMRIDASGNVGINDTSPSGRGLLSVRLSDGRHFAVGSNAQPVARYDDNGTPQFTFINYGITGADQGYQMTWQFGDAAANFATAGRIIVRTQQAWTSTASTKDAYMSFFTAADGVDSERARITSDGFFKAQGNSTYINSTAPSHEFINATNNNDTVRIRSNAASGTQYGLDISTANDQNDATRYFITCTGNTTQRATLRANGGLANYSANNVNLASDQRLKKDISLLDTSWDKVKQIEVVNFRYKDCNEDDPLLYGVIAQQVQPIVPELVVVTQEAKEATEDAEATPEYYGIREQPMYWLAIKALQEAMARIEQLEAKVAALENA